MTLRPAPGKNLTSLILALTAVLSTSTFLNGCAPPSGNSSAEPTPAESARAHVAVSTLPNTEVTPGLGNGKALNPDSPENHAYQEAHELYSAQNCDAALTKLEQFTRKYPRSVLLYQAENLKGLCLLASKQPQVAAIDFQKAMESNHTNPAYRPYLQYNLAKAQFEAGSQVEAEQTLSSLPEEGMDADNRIKLHFLKAAVYNKKGLHFEAAREVLVASPLLSSEPNAAELRKNFDAQLDQCLQDVSGAAQIESLYKESENSPLADLLLYRLAAKEISAGQNSLGEGHIHLLSSRFPTSPYVARANQLLASAQAQAALDRRAVGVLLPLKGKYAKFGQKSLEAIELAFGVFEHTAGEVEADIGVHLVLEDTGDDPDQALRALNRLVLKHHVSAIIGPLLSKGIDRLSQRADELGVPMLSLARFAPNSDNAANHYAVQAGITSQLQSHEIARYAIDTLGLRKFAIAYPKGKAGEESSQAFWDTVDQLGGQIVGYESYSPSDTDFRQVIDKLSGLYYTEAREHELEDLAKLRKDNKIKKRNRKTEQYFSLPPIVDYQAVFIADEAKTAALIMPTFAYRDVDHVQFLGTSSWNSPDLAASAGSSAEGSVFVDAFFPKSHAPGVQKFLDGFHGTFNQDAGPMEAIAYDAGLVLDHALQDAGKSFDRKDLLGKIHDTKDLDGATGKMTYKDGAIERRLKALSIRGGQIVEDEK